MFVLDSHCDTPSMLLEGIDIGKRQERTQFDFVRAKEGGVDGIFFSVYTPASLEGRDAVNHALKLLSECYLAVSRNAGVAAFAFSPDEAFRNRDRGLISVFLGMENGSPIGNDLSLLRLYYRFGIRYLTLCHSENNGLCDSCSSAGEKWGGLSPFGMEVIAECGRLGILTDCSHASDKAFYDMIDCSVLPVVATHSSCRALCNHPRNMTDSMIRLLAEKGGVVQINFYPCFLDGGFADSAFSSLNAEFDKWQEAYRNEPGNIEYRDRYFSIMRRLRDYPAPSFERVIDHIVHAAYVAGPEHVGTGSDFDGIPVAPEGLRDISMYPALADGLARRGFDGKEIEGILGGNFLRVLGLARQAGQV